VTVSTAAHKYGQRIRRVQAIYAEVEEINEALAEEEIFANITAPRMNKLNRSSFNDSLKRLLRQYDGSSQQYWVLTWRTSKN